MLVLVNLRVLYGSLQACALSPCRASAVLSPLFWRADRFEANASEFYARERFCPGGARDLILVLLSLADMTLLADCW
ncbi:hypothetical protein KCP73_16520 [Salmonella enterica subsp. enterica]|nr:hypothetical protein KCP73_16520 [Salmonella enterica subsp. enterica]